MPRCPAAPVHSSGTSRSGRWTQRADEPLRWRKPPATGGTEEVGGDLIGGGIYSRQTSGPPPSMRLASSVAPGRSSSCDTHLDQHTPAETRLHQRLGHPAGGVGSRAVHLGVVLPGKGSAPMGAPAPVGVHDDFTARQTSVTLRTRGQAEAK